MNTLSASAPGKVVLAGEYAVLDGAPAIAMAVNRRAVATLRRDGRGDTECRGLGGRTDRELLDRVAAALPGAATNLDNASFVLDTCAFTNDQSVKLGVGSSAALALAIARCLAPAAPHAELVAAAARAHRDFQGGAGSGVDIATSAAGGLIEYRMQKSQTAVLGWPAGLHFALLWSGTAASTRDRLARFGAAPGRPSRLALAETAKSAAAAWRSGDASAVVLATQALADALARFSVDHGLGIFEAGHDALRDKAKMDDVVYKPCGAGGGDIGIALATDPAALAGFVALAERSGFQHLDLQPEADGVRIDRG